MKTIRKTITLSLFILLLSFDLSNAQCTGGTNGGSITPSINWQTQSVRGQYYYSFSAIAGYTYTFSFCSADGGSTSYNTELTVNTSGGAAIAGAYNDDYCGTASHLSWTCVTSGNYRIVTSKKTCNTQNNMGTLAYRYDFSYSCPTGLGTGYTSVASLPYTLASGTTCGAVNDVNSIRLTTCGTGSYYDGEDMVWSFTPTATGTITVSLNATANNTSLSIYDACPLNGNGATCIANEQDNGDKSLSFCATAGTTYYVVLDCQSGTGCFAFTNFSISSPQTCALGSGVTNIASLPYTGNYQTTCGGVNDLTAANTPACGNSLFKAQEDNVYIFTPTTSGDIVIRLTSTTNNTGIFLYNGCPYSCTATPGSCIANQTGNGNKTLCVTVTAGTTYYLVVDSRTACFAYNLSISAPSTDYTGRTCSNPAIISSFPYRKLHETTACFGDDYNNASAASCGTSYESGEDKVYRYTATSAICISITITGSSTNNIGYQVYNGCPDVAGTTCIGNLGGATSGTLTGSVTLPSAGTYYIIVDTWSSPYNADYNITIANNNTVYNDLPCNAQSMELGLYYTGNTHCANGSGEPAAPTCWSSPNIVNSVWYSFVAPASGNVLVRTSPGSLKKTQIAAYTGVCGSGLTYVACNLNAPGCGGTSPTPTTMSQLSLTGLTAGNTYYVVVDGEGSSTGSFSIIAIDAGGSLPDITGQECNSPIIVCSQNTAVGDPGFQSFGNICDFPGAGTNCLYTAERGSAWYQINISAAGNLQFDIVPNDWVGAPSTACTDYDFALWKIAGSGATSCSGIAGGATPLRCNYSSLGVTGLYSNSNGNAPSQYPGFGSAYNSQVAVAAGEVYVLVVSNYSNSTSGFTLKFPAGAPVDYTAGGTTAYWTGAEDNNWFNAANWGGCNIPSCSVNAIIPLSGADQPYIGTSGAACKDLKLEPGGTLIIDNNQNLTVCGNIRNNGELNIATGSGFLLNNAAVIQQLDGNLISPNRLANLNINKTGGYVDLLQNIELQGSLTLTGFNSRLDAINKTFTLKGSLSNSGGQFNMGNNGNLVLNGTGTQNISNNDTLTNVIVNKSGSTVQLITNMKIGPTGTLSLLASRIVTGANEVYLMNDASAAVNAGSASSYIEGNLRRKVPTVLSSRVYDFPVGHSAKGYQRLNLNLYNGINPSVGSIQAKFSTFSSDIYGLGLDAMCLVNYGDTMLNNGYWTLTPEASGNGEANVTLYNRTYTNAKTNYTVASNTNGGGWVIPSILSGGCSTPPVTAVLRNGVGLNFSTGQVILVGTGQGYVSPLPVELLSFTVSAGDNSIFTTWSTASEKNNSGFYLQRSMDGINFDNITWVDGNGTSNQMNNYSYEDKTVKEGVWYYYRLKQIDFDGKFNYSDIEKARIGKQTSVSINAIPNPYQGKTQINYSLPGDGYVVLLITDITGRIVKNLDVGYQYEGSYSIPFSAQEAGFPAGIYNVAVYFNNTAYRIKISESK
jgi:hypothetical protein